MFDPASIKSRIQQSKQDQTQVSSERDQLTRTYHAICQDQKARLALLNAALRQLETAEKLLADSEKAFSLHTTSKGSH